MRLKSIKLSGFKSFAEPTRLVFPGNIVCIVGPNGCGKSNTLDAIRWVMGESAARELRGGELNDVLFGGSAHRRAVSQCSVELTFDNADHQLKGAWNRYAEIAVRRVHHREEGTRFYLNGQRVRRRDVVALFDGTGLGPRSYALIGQGNVSQIIEARPEQLRQMIEEAAGIGQYRQRRRETFSRLESARENLAQLQIQHDAWAEQARTLRQQSEAALRHRALTEEQARLQRALFQARYQQTIDRLESDQRSLDEQQRQLARQQLAVEAAQKEIILQEKRLPELEAEMEEARQRFHELDKRLELQASHQQRQRRQRAQLSEQIERMRRQQAEAERAHARAREICEALRSESQAAQEELARWQSQAETLRRQAQRLKKRLEDRQRQAERERWRYRDARRSFEHRQSGLQRLSDQRERLDRQLARHREALEALRRQREALDIDRLAQAYDAAQERLHALEKAQADGAQRLRNGQAAHARACERLEGLRQRHLALTQELKALRSVQARYAPPVSEDWLRRYRAQPLLSAVRVLDPAWRDAVESWLGEWLQGVILPQWPDRWEAVPFAGIGAATRDAGERAGGAAPSAPQGCFPLMEIMQAPGPLQSHIRRVFCCEADAPEPDRLAALPEGVTILTRDGTLWFREGRAQRLQNETGGVLARQQRMAEIESALAQLTPDLRDAERDVEASERERETLQARLDDLRQRLRRREKETLDARHRLASQRELANVLDEQIAAHRTQLRDLRDQSSAVDAELHDARAAVARHESEIAALKAAWRRAEADLERERAEMQAQEQALRSTEARLAAQQARLQTLRQQLEREEEAARHARRRLDRLAPQLSLLTEQLAQLPEADRLDDEIDALRRRRDDAAAQLDACRRRKDALQAELTRQRERLHRQEEKRNRLQQSVNGLELACAQHQQQLQQLAQEAQNHGLSHRDIRQMPLEEVSVTALQQSLRSVRRELASLGAVNMTAVESWEALRRKMDELAEQMADVTRAVEMLERSVRKIDRDSRRQLRETFERINGHFERLFPKVFGGGSASLQWAGTEADPLQDGVLVMARPPGKRNARIQMLSGGEKTLTALALIFAIFEMNPAPFCVLDEVDAPLDDANVQRFCELVKIMAKQVQFILITHNKITMSMADQLIGVTMHEPGVSRAVSVDMQTAMEMTEKSEA